MKKILLSIILTAFSASLLLAENPAPASGGAALTFWAVFKLFFMLAVVLGLIFGTVWLLKKLSPQFNRTASANVIKVLSISYLGPKRALILVEILDRIMLVGATECDIRLLTEFKDPEEIARLRALTGKTSPADAFSSALSSFFQKKTVK